VRESDIERACWKYALERGVPSFKIQGGVTGDPDRVFLLFGDRSWLVEFKAPGGRLSPRQLVRHLELARLGQHVTVIYSTEKFKELLHARLVDVD
jgi:hypothetical protein